MSYTFILASTTQYGVLCAQQLIQAGFTCVAIITPPARPVGRQQILQPTASEIFAQENHLPLFFNDKKLTPAFIASLPACDFLLVIDFGYFIPEALTALPKYLAFNIHPSALPKYRGSSPGQAVILAGDATSAVSFIQISPVMDAGDLLAQIPFTVSPTWNKTQYYDFAFALAAQKLPALLSDFALGKIALTPQHGTPTLAPRLARADGFIADLQVNPTLTYRKFLAYSPWPGIWTLTSAGKRLKVLACHLDSRSQLVLDLVQLEGEKPKKPLI